MNYLIRVCVASAWNRRFTLAITICAIAVSVALLLGVERLRSEAREGFAQSVSRVDLIVGARTSPVQLLLYSVFHLGEATHNINWASFTALESRPEVAWAIPLSLGDSHKGFPVLGTTASYFGHFRYNDGVALAFQGGKVFAGLYDAVIGADVARELGYRIGDRIVLNHGSGETALTSHSDKPFVISGVLARTGTPVDRTVHVSLEAIEAIHLDWRGGAPMPGVNIPPELARKFDLTPKSITAVMIGLKSRAAVFRVQRQINSNADEPLLAVLPGVALDELWQVVSVVERTLLAVSAMVVVSGLAGLMAVMFASLNERRRELAVLRSVGARPRDVYALVALEGAAVTLLGALLGVLALYLLSWMAAPLVQAQFGVAIAVRLPTHGELYLFGATLLAGAMASLAPAWRAYRLSLSDGLSPRL
jgi:putative ABC transport system permease protein